MTLDNDRLSKKYCFRHRGKLVEKKERIDNVRKKARLLHIKPLIRKGFIARIKILWSLIRL